MKRVANIFIAIATALASCAALAQSMTVAWETKAELNGPESALYDRQRDVIYVSNVNGKPSEADGNGYIATLSPTGEILKAQWITGMNAPKGLAMVGGKLYVSDIDQLVEIDIEADAITNRWQGIGAKFLNDVAADSDGNIYVSDMSVDRIYRLRGGTFDVWVENSQLENPNGLHVEGDNLVVGAWGKMTDGFNTAVPGHLKTVSLKDGVIKSLGDGSPVGNLDGVEPDGKGNYLVTDWMAGKLFVIEASGKAKPVLQLTQGAADLAVIEDKALVIIPMMMENKVVAYKMGQ